MARVRIKRNTKRKTSEPIKDPFDMIEENRKFIRERSKRRKKRFPFGSEF